MTKNKITHEKKPRELIGKLVSIGGNTIKIRVERKFAHKKYGKIVKSHKKYLADYRGTEEIALGSQIRIIECKPISRRKTWKFVDIIKAEELIKV